MGKLIQAYTTLEAAVAIAAVAAGAPILQLNPPQTLADKPTTMGLVRLRVVLTTAVLGYFGLVRAATAGTPTAPGTQIGLGASSGGGGYGGGAGPGRLLSLWTVAPTVSLTPEYYEQDLLPGAVGDRFEWTWPESDPLTAFMASSELSFDKGLILQNLSGGASPALLVSARWIEFSSSGA